MNINKEVLDLSGLTLGSVYKEEGDKKLGGFHDSIFKGDVKIFNNNPLSYSKTLITGESRSALSTSMNKGSLSVSAQYGISGIASASTSASGYYGKSYGEKSDNIEINFHNVIVTNREEIDFANNNITQIIESMKTIYKHLLVTCLEDYVSLKKALKDANVSPKDFVNSKSKYENIIPLYNKWRQSCDRFYSRVGDSFVYSIYKGGISSIKGKVIDKSKNVKQSYGASLNLSISSIKGGGSVGSVYDGTKEYNDRKITVEWEKEALGDIVLDYTNKWFEALSKPGTEKLWATNIASLAPTIPESRPDDKELPKPPEAPKKLTDLMGNIGTKEDLKLFAQLKAFDDRKNKSESLEEFISKSDKNTDVKRLESEFDVMKSNRVGDRLYKDNNKQILDEVSSVYNFKQEKFEHESKNVIYTSETYKQSGNTITLEARLVNFRDIFPWTNNFLINELNDGDYAKLSLENGIRTISQDFMNLSKCYEIAASGNLTMPLRHSLNSPSFDAMRKVFYSLSGKVLTSPIIINSNNVDQLFSSSIVEYLRSESLDWAWVIYEKLLQNPVLRDFELGGVILNKNLSFQSIKVYGSIELEGSSSNKSLKETVTKYTDNEAGKSEFSQTMKMIPIIMPDGAIVAVSEFSNGKLGYLIEDNDGGRNTSTIVVSSLEPDRQTPYILFYEGASVQRPREIYYRLNDKHPYHVARLQGVLRADEIKGQGISKNVIIEFIPIKYSDAIYSSENWKGVAISKSLRSFKSANDSLNNQLDNMKKKPSLMVTPKDINPKYNDFDEHFTSSEMKKLSSGTIKIDGLNIK